MLPDNNTRSRISNQH